MNRSKWERRIQRADELATAHPFAVEVLTFYKHVAGFQQKLYSYIEASYIKAANGNAANKKATGLLLQPTPEHTETLLAWIFLQPYAEYLADHSKPMPHNERVAVCPFCSGRPLVGVLRPEGDGAKRSLICSLCSTEWTYGRIVCPACGEETVEKLAIYTASQFHQVRVEACDTCHYYIKTVDLTKNGHAVPVVDELATIPLNLWAQQHQYTKLQPNLLGI